MACAAGLGRLCCGGDNGSARGGIQSQSNLAHHVAKSSLVIVGMRGAGKTSLGEACAAALGWRFIDVDQAYTEQSGRKIADLVAAEGMAAFRREELATLRRLLREAPTESVIACGGGIVETPAALTALQNWWPVVHICKPIADVCQALDAAASSGRANLGEAPSVTFARRLPVYERCSDFEFHIRPNERNWDALGSDFAALARRIYGLCPEPRFDEDSFFLSLTFPDVRSHLQLLPILSQGVDSLELRVDLLESQEPAFVYQQLAEIRRVCPDTSVVFTVRSEIQGGQFRAGPEAMASLLRVGVRSACEFVDIEVDMPRHLLKDVLALIQKGRGTSRIIGSHHDMKRMPPLAECEGLMRKCALNGAAAVAKLVVGTSRLEDIAALQNVADKLRPTVPCIAINVGSLGQMSRVMNRVFTPVTHPQLPAKAAPGQLSAAEIMQARRSLGYCAPKVFHIFGSTSALPIFKGAFECAGSPHFSAFLASEDAEAGILPALEDSGCGGGAILINSVVGLPGTLATTLALCSPAARDLGAVDTVVKLPDGSLQGENTAWLAIMRCLKSRLGTRMVQAGTGICALVIGDGLDASAACYALRALDKSAVLFVHNQADPDRAAALAQKFGGQACQDLARLSPPRLDVIFAAAKPLTSVPIAAVMPPAELLRRRPVVCDPSCYGSSALEEPPLIRLARQSGCPTVSATELLLEQVCVQCELWTRRPASRSEVQKTLKTPQQLSYVAPVPGRVVYSRP